jgi:hypothetical protein
MSTLPTVAFGDFDLSAKCDLLLGFISFQEVEFRAMIVDGGGCDILDSSKTEFSGFRKIQPKYCMEYPPLFSSWMRVILV